MARVRKPEYCMICDSLPCICNGDKKRTPRKATVDIRPEQVPLLNDPAPKRVHTASDEQLAFAKAIQTLAPILHPEELAQYSSIISDPLSLAARTAAWRARREERNASTS